MTKPSHLLNLFRGGNVSLGSKLANLLTEDCEILEYTSDSVLFSKGEKLVLAKFKTPAPEEALTPSHILENKVLRMDKKSLEKALKKSLRSLIENVATDNLVVAEDQLKSFCESYTEMSVLAKKYPSAFVDARPKFTKGITLRKEAESYLPEFKATIFNAAVVSEGKFDNPATLNSLFDPGVVKVFALGKEAVNEAIKDAVMGSAPLANKLSGMIYSIFEAIKEDKQSDELAELDNDSYDFESGNYPEEVAEDDSEEVAFPDVATEEETIEDNDEEKPFEEFDPSKLSEEDTRQLHKTILYSILNSISDFVRDKAGELEAVDIPADLSDQLQSDIAALEDEDLSDARLIEIEAKWEPVLNYFLDSEYHTPEEEVLSVEEPASDEILPEPVETEPIVQAPDQMTPVAPAPEAAPAIPGTAPEEEQLPQI